MTFCEFVMETVPQYLFQVVSCGFTGGGKVGSGSRITSKNQQISMTKGKFSVIIRLLKIIDPKLFQKNNEESMSHFIKRTLWFITVGVYLISCPFEPIGGFFGDPFLLYKLSTLLLSFVCTCAVLVYKFYFKQSLAKKLSGYILCIFYFHVACYCLSTFIVDVCNIAVFVTGDYLWYVQKAMSDLFMSLFNLFYSFCFAKIASNTQSDIGIFRSMWNFDEGPASITMCGVKNIMFYFFSWVYLVLQILFQTLVLSINKKKLFLVRQANWSMIQFKKKKNWPSQYIAMYVHSFMIFHVICK